MNLVGGTAEARRAVDVVYDGARVTVLESEFIETGNTHGTGCTLAAAIACELAKGHAPLQAIRCCRTSKPCPVFLAFLVLLYRRKANTKTPAS